MFQDAKYRTDIEVTNEQIASGVPVPLHVRRGSEPALNLPNGEFLRSNYNNVHLKGNTFFQVLSLFSIKNLLSMQK